MVVLSQCSTSVITESTWLMLEDLLREPGWPRQHFGHHVGRLYAMRLGAVCHLANTPPETVFPLMARRNGGFLGPEPLRRVRLSGEGRSGPVDYGKTSRMRFSRGYDVIMPHFLEAPPACAFQGWRQILRRQLVTTTTARLLVRISP